MAWDQSPMLGKYGMFRVISRVRDHPHKAMEHVEVRLAATMARAPRSEFRMGGISLWRRIITISSLMLADLFSFTVADLTLHFFTTPPALAMFRGRSLGTPNTVIDLMSILALLFVAARYLAGDYSRRKLFWDGARATTGALLINGAVYMAAAALLERDGVIISALVWFCLLFLLPCMRQAMRHGLSYLGMWKLPTAILGTSAMAQEVLPALAKQLSLGLDVRWVVADKPGGPVPHPLTSLSPVLAAPENLAHALFTLGCRQVILVLDDSLPMDQSDLIDELVGSDISVAIIPSLRRLPLFGLSTSHFFGKDLLLLQVRNNLARLPQRFVKRAFDFVGSIAALLLLWPVFAIIAYVIKREDGGPVFFVQHRVGLYGEDFRCWKFRTMSVDAEAQMARWSHENPELLERYRQSNFKLMVDPRVTCIGTWLRRKSLDELPQLFNVVLGEMSLVGPRPLLRRELPDYGAVIALYKRVRPGITGLWQINGRSHTTFAERVSYDEWYIKNWTVWYDTVILLQTVGVLLAQRGAY